MSKWRQRTCHTTGLREDGVRSDGLDIMASTRMNDKDLLECKNFEVDQLYSRQVQIDLCPMYRNTASVCQILSVSGIHTLGRWQITQVVLLCT